MASDDWKKLIDQNATDGHHLRSTDFAKFLEAEYAVSKSILTELGFTKAMTAMIGIDSLEGAIGMQEAIDLLERTIAHEEAGRTSVSPKFITEFENGVMRVLFAADGEAGYCAMKAYHNVRNAGTRYVVLLYSMSDGELLAVLDGRLITDLRTGAVSGVIARRVDIPGPVNVGILGSGNQARTQLEALAAVYAIRRAEVYSPTAANRERYAREMSDEAEHTGRGRRFGRSRRSRQAGRRHREQRTRHGADPAPRMARRLPAPVRRG